VCTLCDGGEEEGRAARRRSRRRADGEAKGEKGRGGGGGAGEERGRGEVLGGSEREARKRAAATARPGKYISREVVTPNFFILTWEA
jgi:hypothetical protein